MYDWLTDSLVDGGTVITANRRLARILSDEFGAQQLRAGKTAWRSPRVHSWQDWLGLLVSNAEGQARLPTRIDSHQSQWLWERCLRLEVGDDLTSITHLVKLSRDAWQRLADWQVPIREVARFAQSDDQRMFAAAAGRYLAILERESWVDDAGLGPLVLELFQSKRVTASGHYTLAGFDRERPLVAAMHTAISTAGQAVTFAPEKPAATQIPLRVFEHGAAEQRAAGAWARAEIERSPKARIAIVVNGLEQDADGIARRVREGFIPGWQHAGRNYFDAVNVSFGRRLGAYPAVATAQLLLRWLVDDLSSKDVSLLLRSPLIGGSASGARSGLELRLRRLADRRWSPSMMTAEFRGADDAEEAEHWLTRLAAFSKWRRELPRQASPADWVIRFDEILKGFGWPGIAPLDSPEFQLVNRYRELLNEFARLSLVSPSMTALTALNRLDMMAAETVFQPESGNALVQLLGPIEASGAEFDALWLTGVSTANWPPAGNPSVLVSRRLQEKHGMPDCTPQDTLNFAQRLLNGLTSAADRVVCSYARTEDDAEQSVSDLLTPLLSDRPETGSDPGWYAASLSGAITFLSPEDPVPPIVAGEKIRGGAATVQRQLSDPVGAFAYGRLGARALFPQAVGIPPPTRGTLIHDALYQLYIDLPASEVIQNWQDPELAKRIADAVNFAFRRQEKNTDAVLHQLLQLERQRIASLLREFVVIDGGRQDFQIASVEGTLEFEAGPLSLQLRFDRIDRYADGCIAILDYKTGTQKRLLDRTREPLEIQLFVYACATDVPVAALALVNVDTRQIAFDGAGRGFTDENEWPALLERVKDLVLTACREMASGDVRVNIVQGLESSRPLNLLTRYTELRHDLR